GSFPFNRPIPIGFVWISTKTPPRMGTTILNWGAKPGKDKFQLSKGGEPSALYGFGGTRGSFPAGFPGLPLRSIGCPGQYCCLLEMVCYFIIASVHSRSSHSKICFMETLLKDAVIVCPENKELHLKKSDITINGGKITGISASIPPKGNMDIIHLKNLHVSLGWFDSGVAFGEPGLEERETISKGLWTAAHSGFTDIVLSSNTLPDSSSDIVFLKERSAGERTGLHPM